MTRCPFRLQIIGIFLFFSPLFPLLSELISSLWLLFVAWLHEKTEAISDKTHKSRQLGTPSFLFSFSFLDVRISRFFCVCQRPPPISMSASNLNERVMQGKADKQAEANLVPCIVSTTGAILLPRLFCFVFLFFFFSLDSWPHLAFLSRPITAKGGNMATVETRHSSLVKVERNEGGK